MTGADSARLARSTVIAYAAAIVAVALATFVRRALDTELGDRVPYATYFPAVAAVAFTGHLGAALVSTVLSALAGTVLFVAPRGSLAVGTAADFVGAALFLIAGGLVAILTDRLSRTRQQFQSAASLARDQRQQVQAERTRLQTLIDSIPGVVWELSGAPGSPDSRVVYVSDYIERLLGYSVEEWRSNPNLWTDLLPPQDRDEVRRAIAAKFAAGDNGEEEFRLIGKDGQIRWLLSRFEIITNQHHQPVGMRGITFDITSRKQTERRLKLLADVSGSAIATLSSEQLAAHLARRLTRIVGDGVIVRIRDGDDLKAVAFDHVSSEALPLVERMAAASRFVTRDPTIPQMLEDPKTMIFDDMAASSADDMASDDLAHLLERFKPRVALLLPMTSRGGLLGTLTMWRSTSLPYSPGDVKLVEAIAARSALALENTRLFESLQRQADEAQHARAAAEEASRVKDEFLATLSHELRTPLNAIVGWAHMLRDPKMGEDRRRTAVDTIVRNAQSQEQLISDILDVQRIMAGKLRLNLASVDLGDVVREAAETVQPSADAKQIRLQLLLDLDVTPIWGDGERLRQVVWNLLNNAIKFTPHGGSVQVRLLRGDDSCELIVQDTGPGISPQFLPLMFERFRQADSSTTRTHKGLGLGLHIVRSLVEMHGGTITASNVDEPGLSGAVFSIRLPRQITQVPAAETPDSDFGQVEDGAWLEDAPSLDGIRVLVVDDDPDAREVLRVILERCGADVSIAGSSQEGLTAIGQCVPDALISDIEMPHEDGYSFIRKVRALPPAAGGTVPAAALTAYAATSDRMKVLTAGFNMHVAKPVGPAELAMIVSSLTGMRRVSAK